MLGYCFFLSRAGSFAWAASLCPGLAPPSFFRMFDSMGLYCVDLSALSQPENKVVIAMTKPTERAVVRTFATKLIDHSVSGGLIEETSTHRRGRRCRKQPRIKLDSTRTNAGLQHAEVHAIIGDMPMQ
jgi:hypothetical protein